MMDSSVAIVTSEPRAAYSDRWGEGKDEHRGSGIRQA